ncbi:TetR family transcriptional regulator [Paenibacillus sp. J31TS4]|uniref:TetR/AcrR family transcriptional regulator n=1 Tax=Paenibacillus sp. J31TS4 TaxID=2807195 RepID=UPI001B1EACB7|nr:TetR/AcrR family transcriptional regulator [Paenibacillus sp. J31TS4]GIP37128.1 TetR family transcriptional regulator [Paenibacillus sp. J31TS4]
MPYPDIRVVRTRSLLKQALLSLMLETCFDRITIKDLAGRAGINRVTFYTHYNDKEALLLELVEEKLKEYEAFFQLEPAASETPQAVQIRQIAMTVRHVRENALFYQVVLLTDDAADLAARMQERLSGALHRALLDSSLEPSELDLRLYSHWTMGGILSVFRDWLRNGLQEDDPAIVRQIALLTWPGSPSGILRAVNQA